jgi:hypothetical protein
MRQSKIAATVALLFAAAACANEPAGGGAGGIQHPTGRDQIVLRLSYEGGFVPLEYNLTQIPAFALYGNGRIVLPGAQIELYPGPALPAVNQRDVTEEGLQSILQAALDAGLGRGDRDYSDFASTMIADASTAVFTFSAAGKTSRVSAYALAELPDRPTGMPLEEFEARQALADLAERLGLLEQWLPEGSIGPEGPFAPAGYRLFVGPYRPAEDLPQEPAVWPLATPLPTSGDDGTGYACLTVAGDDWSTLQPLARSANELTPWTNEGNEFTVLFRPLLPDESGC